ENAAPRAQGTQPSEPVQPGELLSYVGDPRLGRDGTTGGALYELVRSELPSMLVHVLTEPAEQRRELACLQLTIQPRHILAPRRRYQLSAYQVAQRVPDNPAQGAGPVDVLQGALSIRGWLQREVLADPRGPGFWYVRHGQTPVQQVVLDLEPQQYVQVVSHLVGVDADIGRPHSVTGAPECLCIHILERFRESPSQPRVEPLVEGAAPTHHILPEARLGLVHPRRGSPRQGRPVEGPGHALLVHRVPGFVDRRKEAGVAKCRSDARGKTDVTGSERYAEGMHREVLPATFQVVSEVSDGLAGELDLPPFIARPRHHRVVHPVAMPVDGVNQGHRCGLDPAEKLLDAGGGEARLGELDQRVVRPLLVAQRIGEPPRQVDRHLHRRHKKRPVGTLPRVLPDWPSLGGG